MALKLPQKSIVEITAYPYKSYKFDHWSGDASGTSSTIQVTMDSDKTIVAHFVSEKKEKPVLSYTPNYFDFGKVVAGEEISGNVTIWNNGAGVLDFEIVIPDDNDIPRDKIKIYPVKGTSKGPDDLVIVRFWIDTTGMLPGEYRGLAFILSNAGNGTVSGRVSIVEGEEKTPPLTADFCYFPLHPVVNITVLFDASKSVGDIGLYRWYCSYEAQLPKLIGEGKRITYAFDKPGNWSVTLEIWDESCENSNSTTKLIKVMPIPEEEVITPSIKTNETANHSDNHPSLPSKNSTTNEIDSDISIGKEKDEIGTDISKEKGLRALIHKFILRLLEILDDHSLLRKVLIEKLYTD